MLLNIILGILILWLLLLTWKLFSISAHYNKLVNKVDKKNLSEILNQIINKQKETDDKITGLEKYKNHLEIEKLTHFQKIGLVRFNPFTDSGSNQSFVIALLNGENNGLVISSLHSRQQSRWYAKPVIAGNAKEYEFSEEEKKAVREAINNGK